MQGNAAAAERDGGIGPDCRPGRRSEERARAAAYLDLWERHVGLIAIHGPAPPPHREKR